MNRNVEARPSRASAAMSRANPRASSASVTALRQASTNCVALGVTLGSSAACRGGVVE